VRRNPTLKKCEKTLSRNRFDILGVDVVINIGAVGKALVDEVISEKGEGTATPAASATSCGASAKGTARAIARCTASAVATANAAAIWL
jgi:hypothetical protein